MYCDSGVCDLPKTALLAGPCEMYQTSSARQLLSGRPPQKYGRSLLSPGTYALFRSLDSPPCRYDARLHTPALNLCACGRYQISLTTIKLRSPATTLPPKDCCRSYRCRRCHANARYSNLQASPDSCRTMATPKSAVSCPVEHSPSHRSARRGHVRSASHRSSSPLREVRPVKTSLTRAIVVQRSRHSPSACAARAFDVPGVCLSVV